MTQVQAQLRAITSRAHLDHVADHANVGAAVRLHKVFRPVVDVCREAGQHLVHVVNRPLW